MLLSKSRGGSMRPKTAVHPSYARNTVAIVVDTRTSTIVATPRGHAKSLSPSTLTSSWFLNLIERRIGCRTRFFGPELVREPVISGHVRPDDII